MCPGGQVSYCVQTQGWPQGKERPLQTTGRHSCRRSRRLCDRLQAFTTSASISIHRPACQCQSTLHKAKEKHQLLRRNKQPHQKRVLQLGTALPLAWQAARGRRLCCIYILKTGLACNVSQYSTPLQADLMYAQSNCKKSIAPHHAAATASNKSDLHGYIAFHTSLQAGPACQNLNNTHSNTTCQGLRHR